MMHENGPISRAGNTSPEFSGSELDTATATLKRRVERVRGSALKVASRVRCWLDVEGQAELDEILNNKDVASVLLDLFELVHNEIDQLIALEYHLVRIMPLPTHLQKVQVQLIHQLNRLNDAEVTFLARRRRTWEAE